MPLTYGGYNGGGARYGGTGLSSYLRKMAPNQPTTAYSGARSGANTAQTATNNRPSNYNPAYNPMTGYQRFFNKPQSGGLPTSYGMNRNPGSSANNGRTGSAGPAYLERMQGRAMLPGSPEYDAMLANHAKFAAQAQNMTGPLTHEQRMAPMMAWMQQAQNATAQGTALPMSPYQQQQAYGGYTPPPMPPRGGGGAPTPPTYGP